jgi:hypothetical protein
MELRNRKRLAVENSVARLAIFQHLNSMKGHVLLLSYKSLSICSNLAGVILKARTVEHTGHMYWDLYI